MQNRAEIPIFILKAILVFQTNLANLTVEEKCCIAQNGYKKYTQCDNLKKRTTYADAVDIFCLHYFV